MSNLNKLSFKKSKIKTQEVDYLVVVDSEIWKEYFNKQDLTESNILSTLIREDKIAICGYSFVRILQGIRDQDNFEKLLKGLLALPYIEIEKEDWVETSKLLFKFKNLSFELALLCALTRNKKLRILTRHREIKNIDGVKLYEDEKE